MYLLFRLLQFPLISKRGNCSFPVQIQSFLYEGTLVSRYGNWRFLMGNWPYH